MASAAPATIILKGCPIYKERVAAGTITPGHMVTLGSGDTLTAGPAAQVACRSYALENEVFGKGITDNYVTGDNVLYGVFPPGAEVYAFVSAAVTRGAVLESAGAGALRTITAGGAPIAIALETTAGAGRCKVEVL